MSMQRVTLSEAYNRFAELVQAAIQGDDIILMHDGTPVAKIVPFTEPATRPLFGSARGLMLLADEFDLPISAEPAEIA